MVSRATPPSRHTVSIRHTRSAIASLGANQTKASFILSRAVGQHSGGGRRVHYPIGFESGSRCPAHPVQQRAERDSPESVAADSHVSSAVRTAEADRRSVRYLHAETVHRVGAWNRWSRTLQATPSL